MADSYEEAKKTIMRDNVEKQFEIQFPNKEHATITNENIVANSIKFTESLCSSSNLKFGLCEANVFEATVNCKEDVTGLKIKVRLLIDVEDFGKQGFDYGVFVIESCKRQAGTNLRKIVAYEQTGVTSNINAVEQFRRSIPTYAVSDDETDISVLLYNSLPYEIQDAEQITPSRSGRTIRGYKNGKEFRITYYYLYTRIKASTDKNVYSVEGIKGVNFEKKIARLKELSGYIKIEYPDVNPFFFSPYPFIEYFTRYNGSYIVEADSRYTEMKLGERAYLHINGFVEAESGKNPYQYMALYVPYEFHIYEGNVETEVINIYDEDYVYILRHQPNLNLNLDYKIKLKRDVSIPTPSGNDKGQIVMRNMYYIDDKVANNYSLSEFLNSYLELNGQFGRLDRNGKFETISINKNFALYPEDALYPNDEIYPMIGSKNYQPLSTTAYKAADYEEYEVHKIGYVRVTYLAKDNEKYSITVKCDSRYDNVYDMTNNFIFLNSIWTAEQVKQMILTLFYPNVKDISYHPADLNIKGLPFIEAGDVIKVFADDGAFKTFVFRRTLSGEQSLTDRIEAKGDERNPNSAGWLINIDMPEQE